jgi:hypothetical protein
MRDAPYNDEYRELIESGLTALDVLLRRSKHDSWPLVRRGYGEIRRALERDDEIVERADLGAREREVDEAQQLDEIYTLPHPAGPDGPLNLRLSVIRSIGWRHLPALEGVTLLELSFGPRDRVTALPGVGPVTMQKIDAAMREHGLWYRQEAAR